jgi:hypothetical protein
MPHLRIAASQPHGLRRLARLAVALVRKGDARSLTESLLARDREVSDYQDWIDAYDTLSDGDRGLMRHHADGLAHRPLISVLMPTYDAAEDWLRRAIESVRRQLYPHWELCIADDASTAPHVRRVLEEYRRSIRASRSRTASGTATSPPRPTPPSAWHRVSSSRCSISTTSSPSARSI